MNGQQMPVPNDPNVQAFFGNMPGFMNNNQPQMNGRTQQPQNPNNMMNIQSIMSDVQVLLNGL